MAFGDKFDSLAAKLGRERGLRVRPLAVRDGELLFS